MGNKKLYLQRALCLLLLTLVAGCGEYPEFSPKAYEISSALYATCRQKNADNLDKVSELTQEALDNGEISSREAAWINAIVADAESGDWQAAAEESRAILEAQVQKQ